MASKPKPQVADEPEAPKVPEISLPRFFVVQAGAVSGRRNGKPFDFPQGALVCEDELEPHVDSYLEMGAIEAFEGEA